MKKNKLEDLKKDYMDIEIPDRLESVVNEAIKSNESRDKKRKNISTKWVSIAAGFAVFVFLSNVSPAFANTLSKVPIVGGLVKLVTIKNYTVKEGNIEADINIPKVEGLENKNLEDTLNKEFMAQGKEIYDNLIKEMPEIKEGHKYIGSDFSIKADTDKILSIEIIKEEIQASSYVSKKHYTIDKDKQIVLTLPALFKDDKYIEVISSNIKEQMRSQMKNDENKAYFLDPKDIPVDDFNEINKNQDFYIDSNNNLVICFDKYEVAPGYMGAVEFVIPEDLVNSLK